MQEQERYRLANTTAEAMYHLWELEYQQDQIAVDQMMRRLKDLSAYSLTHAEIMDLREGPELLALGMFFGMTSNPTFHRNQERLTQLSQEAIDYPGNAEAVEQQVARRQSRGSGRNRESNSKPMQPRLL